MYLFIVCTFNNIIYFIIAVVVLGNQLSVSDLNCGRAGGNIDYPGDDAWVYRWVICPWVVCN